MNNWRKKLGIRKQL